MRQSHVWLFFSSWDLLTIRKNRNKRHQLIWSQRNYISTNFTILHFLYQTKRCQDAANCRIMSNLSVDSHGFDWSECLCIVLLTDWPGGWVRLSKTLQKKGLLCSQAMLFADLFMHICQALMKESCWQTQTFMQNVRAKWDQQDTSP